MVVKSKDLYLGIRQEEIKERSPEKA